jgi:putative peptidoglycan lipid II flippase
VLPAVASGSRHLLALAIIIGLHGRLGIRSLPLAFVAAAVYQLLVLAARWKSLDVPIRWSLGAAAELRRPLRLAVPLILGSSAAYLTVLVTRVVASHLQPGSVTILDYASRILSSLMEVLTAGVLLVVLANWSHALQQESVEALRGRLRRTVVLVLFLTLPVLTILFALREPAVTLLLGRGQFNAELVTATASVLAVLLLATPLDVVGRIYMRYFIAQQSTWTVAFASAVRLVLVGMLSLLLVRPLQLEGLALTEALSVSIMGVFYVAMADAQGGRTLAGTAWSLIRMTALAVLAGVVAAAVASLLQGAPVLLLAALSASAGGLAYVLGAWLTGAAELRSVLGMFGRRVAGAS